MGTLGTESLSGAEKQELMEQIKEQIAVANAQELITKMTEKCFHKCIETPGSSLDNYEQKCLAMCMDRYMESWNIVSKVYSNRLLREKERL